LHTIIRHSKYKGLFDEYRRPKLAFDVVSRHFNGMKQQLTQSPR